MPRASRRRAITALALASALTCAPLSAAAARPAHTAPKPTIVLEHGAFADASGWNTVATALQSAGYTVIAPANPLRGLPQDAARLSSLLSSIDGPIVLVGHSYGGAVITQSGSQTNVKALVYLAAYALDEEESLGELQGRFPDSALAEALVFTPSPLGNLDGNNPDVTVAVGRFAADV
ncbi:esterase/lipase family protein, partial [Streptomyces sp. NPDC127574]|uniref:esterase/lipase family protein n=1 Tax=Streptomyces sp. NPDC127574 TaxID=3345401 RepID=UPI00362E6A8F